jgi:hypothetical protein
MPTLTNHLDQITFYIFFVEHKHLHYGTKHIMVPYFLAF